MYGRQIRSQGSYVFPIGNLPDEKIWKIGTFQSQQHFKGSAAVVDYSTVYTLKMIIFLHHIKSDVFVLETTNILFLDCSPQQDDILKESKVFLF